MNWRADTLVLVGILAVSVLVWGLGWMKLFHRILYALRRRENLETFKARFDETEYPIHLLNAAYEHFQDLTGLPAFPVRPSDRLDIVYGLTDDALFETLSKLRTIAYGDATLPDNLPRIQTVEEAIRFAAAPLPNAPPS